MINPFHAIGLFQYPPENIRKPEVFLCFLMFLGGVEIDQGIKWVNMPDVQKDVSEDMMIMSVYIVLVYILKAHSIDLCVSLVGFEHVIFSVIVHRNGFLNCL